jgi:hypothetical protein
MRAQEFVTESNQPGVSEGATVTRIDSKLITDFASGLKAYKHTDDWSQSGVDTGDDSYWKNKNLKTNTTKGLFAGDPRRTALYATGNAYETRYVEFTQNGQPIVYFDQKDLPAMRSRKTYLTVFDASNFKQLPTGEWFSENPGKPIKQMPIGDPFKYIASQGWIVRVTDDLDKVFKQVKNMHKAGKIAQYGAEGMNESQLGVAESWGVSKEPIPLPIGDYLAGGSDEFAPPGNYQSAEELHDEVYDQIDAGVEAQVVTVDPRKLLATQDWLSNAGGDDPLFDEYEDRPVIYQKAGRLYILDGHHRTTRAWRANKPISVYLFSDKNLSENFADGKVKGKSRPGRVKRAGASCNGSVTDLRARAKKASGERAKMYHWCANMKSGRNKNK